MGSSGFASSQNNDMLKKMKTGDKHGQKTENSLRGCTLSCHRSGQLVPIFLGARTIKKSIKQSSQNIRKAIASNYMPIASWIIMLIY